MLLTSSLHLIIIILSVILSLSLFYAQEEKGENRHKRGYDRFTKLSDDEMNQFSTSNFENELTSNREKN